jgi:hypothetical protein
VTPQTAVPDARSCIEATKPSWEWSQMFHTQLIPTHCMTANINLIFWPVILLHAPGLSAQKFKRQDSDIISDKFPICVCEKKLPLSGLQLLSMDGYIRKWSELFFCLIWATYLQTDLLNPPKYECWSPGNCEIPSIQAPGLSEVLKMTLNGLNLHPKRSVYFPRIACASCMTLRIVARRAARLPYLPHYPSHSFLLIFSLYYPSVTIVSCIPRARVPAPEYTLLRLIFARDFDFHTNYLVIYLC